MPVLELPTSAPKWAREAFGSASFAAEFVRWFGLIRPAIDEAAEEAFVVNVAARERVDAALESSAGASRAALVAEVTEAVLTALPRLIERPSYGFARPTSQRAAQDRLETQRRDWLEVLDRLANGTTRILGALTMSANAAGAYVDHEVADEAYDATNWNDSFEVPTKNAIRDWIVANIAYGAYTPTLTNVANLDASTAAACTYFRVGNIVHVAGRFLADATAAGLCQLGISLPIASALALTNDCNGVCASATAAAHSGMIVADAANDRAEAEWVAVATVLGNLDWRFEFDYNII